MAESVYISGAKEREIDTLQVHCFQGALVMCYKVLVHHQCTGSLLPESRSKGLTNELCE